MESPARRGTLLYKYSELPRISKMGILYLLFPVMLFTSPHGFFCVTSYSVFAIFWALYFA